MDNIGVGVIGLGDMGYLHALGFYNLKHCTLAAICDISDKALENTLKKLDGEKPAVYKNYKDLINDENVDAVVIAVPNYLHRQMAVEALDAKKDVFLEKPITVSYKDYLDIVSARDRNKKILQVGHEYRYSNLYRKMADIAGKGELGNVMFMWCQELRQCFPQIDWFYDQAKCGGTIVEKNVHHFDIFNWVINSKPKLVFAMGGQHVYKKGQECLVDCNYCPRESEIMDDISTVDHAIVSIEYENEARANLNLCMYLKPENLSNNGLEIGAIGDNGMQLIANRDRVLSLLGGKDSTKTIIEVDCKTDRNGETGHIGFYTERVDFINCVRERREPCVTLERALDSLLIALAAEKSIKEKRAVSVDELK